MSVRLMQDELADGRLKIFRNTSGEWDRTFKIVYHRNKLINNEIDCLNEVLKRYRSPVVPPCAVASLTSGE